MMKMLKKVEKELKNVQDSIEIKVESFMKQTLKD